MTPKRPKRKKQKTRRRETPLRKSLWIPTSSSPRRLSSRF